jgi:Basic region leucine zipper
LYPTAPASCRHVLLSTAYCSIKSISPDAESWVCYRRSICTDSVTLSLDSIGLIGCLVEAEQLPLPILLRTPSFLPSILSPSPSPLSRHQTSNSSPVFHRPQVFEAVSTVSLALQLDIFQQCVQSELPESSSSLNGSLPNQWESPLVLAAPTFDSAFCFSDPLGLPTHLHSFVNTPTSSGLSDQYSHPDFPQTSSDQASFEHLPTSAYVTTEPFIFNVSNDELNTTSISRSASSLSQSLSPSANGTLSPQTTLRNKPGRKRALSIETADQTEKRQRNNAAAAKYRQKKVDRISELEQSLDDVAKDRDALKLELVKRDAEIALLSRLLAEKRGGGS